MIRTALAVRIFLVAAGQIFGGRSNCPAHNTRQSALDYARRCALDPPSAPLGPFNAHFTRPRGRYGDFGASYVHLGSITLPPVELWSDLGFCGSI